MNNYNSVLSLEKLVFDRIQFERKGFKNEKELLLKMQVQIGKGDDEVYKVTIVLNGEKEGEYEFEISLSGFFRIEGDDKLDNSLAQNLIDKNAVAILMPYMRSELTLLTSQPETDSVVLPPLNINKLLDK